MRHRGSHIGALAAGALAFAFAARAAEYHISAGDVLELSVVGVPELQHKTTVAPGGTASFPLVDDLAAEGRTVSQVREELRSKLSRKVAPRSTGSGLEDTVAFSPEQINLAIVEYRPVYVTGHVAQPGEQRYRIGMTAREAIAIAGGLGLGSSGDNRQRSLETQAEYSVLLNELAREQMRLARLEAEYEGKRSLTLKGVEGMGLAEFGTGADTARFEAEQLEQRAVEFAKDKAHLQMALETVDRHLALLRERRLKEAAGLESDQADFNRVSELFKSGATVIGRVAEARRSVLLSATQLLQTDASIATAERETLTLKRETERLDEKRRQALVNEIPDAKFKIQNLQAKLLFLGQQVALIPPASPGNDEDDATTVSIFRRVAGEKKRIVASEDDELRPGDVVQVNLAGMPSGILSAPRRRERPTSTQP